MEEQNDVLSQKVRNTMHMITNMEKNLTKKHAESLSELEILKIKYGNLKHNYRSVNMSPGLRALGSSPSPFNVYQSYGKASEVNIGDIEQKDTGASESENYVSSADFQ